MAFAGLALLLVPLTPKLGQNINGARLWVRLGPVTFQPVELAKIALIIFFASYFVEKRELLTVPTVRQPLTFTTHLLRSRTRTVRSAVKCSHHVIFHAGPGKNVGPQDVGAASAQGRRALADHFICLLLMDRVRQSVSR